jgi:hypothetical protein
MSRDYEVRLQGYAMDRAIEAKRQGDLKTFRGAVEEVTRAGHAVGIRARTSKGFPPLGDETRHKADIFRASPKRRTKTMVTV